MEISFQTNQFDWHFEKQTDWQIAVGSKNGFKFNLNSPKLIAMFFLWIIEYNGIKSFSFCALLQGLGFSLGFFFFGFVFQKWCLGLSNLKLNICLRDIWKWCSLVFNFQIHQLTEKNEIYISFFLLLWGNSKWRLNNIYVCLLIHNIFSILQLITSFEVISKLNWIIRDLKKN